MSMKSLLLFIALSISCAFAQDSSSLYNDIESHAPGDSSPIDTDTWKAAVNNFFTACYRGECQCLLIVSKKVDAITHFAWAGVFPNGQTKELMSNYGGFNQKWGQNFNNRLSVCTVGATSYNIAQTFSGGDISNCCVEQNGVDICSKGCGAFQERASALDIPKDRRNRHIYYGIALQLTDSSVTDPDIMMHEEARKCSGPSKCGASRGCIRIYANAMKDICERHTGMTAKATGQEFKPRGGAYLFFRNNSTPQGGSRSDAERGLEKYMQKCGGVSTAQIGNGSPIDVGMSSSFPGSSSSPSSSSNSSSNYGQSSGGDGLFAFLAKLFSGMGSSLSTGGVSQSNGAYSNLVAEREHSGGGRN